jgi:hypothetical protein
MITLCLYETGVSMHMCKIKIRETETCMQRKIKI